MSRSEYEERHAIFFRDHIEPLLKWLDASILGHEYYYESFGSWFVRFERAGRRYSLIYDGRDFRLTVETPDQTEIAATEDLRNADLSFATKTIFEKFISLSE